ncbi:MAG TPA: rRNA maturation RNase YbeY, partial [Puia sp.]
MVPCPLSGRKRLKAFISGLFRLEKHQLKELSYVFCSDPYLLALNRKFLDHDYYTDILTFPSSYGAGKGVSGEIYISVDRVRENAKNLGHSFRMELHRVIFHGALHLCQYKDKTKKDKA